MIFRNGSVIILPNVANFEILLGVELVVLHPARAAHSLAVAEAGKRQANLVLQSVSASLQQADREPARVEPAAEVAASE